MKLPVDTLFLDDDIRRTTLFQKKIPSAKCVETAQEVIDILSNASKVTNLFLDHDLGGEQMVSSDREDTGMEVVRWIEKNRPNIFRIYVHSHNPPASREMETRLRNLGYHTTRVPFASLIHNIKQH